MKTKFIESWWKPPTLLGFLTILGIILLAIITKISQGQYTNVVFINPDKETTGTGTKWDEFNSWDWVDPESNTIYLQKAGTEEIRETPMISLSHINGDLHDILISQWGVGDLPRVIFTGSSNAAYFKYTKNITIQYFELIGTGRGDAILLSGHTNTAPNTENTTIRKCKIHNWGGGVTAMVFDQNNNYPNHTIVDKVVIDGCEIYDIGEDGVFGTFENLTVQNCHIYKVNTHWFTAGHSQTLSGGDCIHIRGDNYLILNNILDRSGTGNKFCFIYGNQQYMDHRGKILWNTFYPPQDTIDDDGGACIYISHSAYVEIAYNKFIGRGYKTPFQFPSGGMHVETDTCLFYYNLVDSISGFYVTDESSNQKIEFMNNTFVNQSDDDWPVIMTWDYTTAKNNIFALHSGEPFLLFGGFIPDTSNNIIVVGSNNFNAIKFKNIPNSDYDITKRSPAYRSGFNYYGYSTDLNGDYVINGRRSVGCYQGESWINRVINSVIR